MELNHAEEKLLGGLMAVCEALTTLDRSYMEDGLTPGRYWVAISRLEGSAVDVRLMYQEDESDEILVICEVEGDDPEDALRQLNDTLLKRYKREHDTYNKVQDILTRNSV